MVSSVRRLHTATGRYETAGYLEGELVGMNFVIERGTGYVISMNKAVPGFPLEFGAGF